jgi:CBS domain-containing protein
MKRQIERLSPKDSVLSASRRMRQTNVGFLPVCDEDGKVLGTLTDRDLVLRILAEDRTSATPVSDVMTRQIVSCTPGEDVYTAGMRMGAEKKSRILVVDEKERLVGVISLSDLAQAEDDAAVGRTMRDVTTREAHP